MLGTPVVGVSVPCACVLSKISTFDPVRVAIKPEATGVQLVAADDALTLPQTDILPSRSRMSRDSHPIQGRTFPGAVEDENGAQLLPIGKTARRDSFAKQLESYQTRQAFSRTMD